MSNVSYPLEPLACQLQSQGFDSELLDSKSWTHVVSSEPSMSDVNPAEKSIMLNQLHSYYSDPSASKLHNNGLAKDSINSEVLDTDYLTQFGNIDISLSDV